MSEASILERSRAEVRRWVEEAGLLGAGVSVLAEPLTVEEAIGEPGRRDFPIIRGKERILEARVLNGRGHAFTDSAKEFIGDLDAALGLALDCNQRRAICVAAMNAATRHLGRVEATVHCRDDEPEECAKQIATTLKAEHPEAVVGLVGFNPALAEGLAWTFGPERLHVTDLAADNIGHEHFGVEVWDGAERTDELIADSDVLLVTGTTLVNDSFDGIEARSRELGKTLVVFGVTGAAVCEAMGFTRMCAMGH